MDEIKLEALRLATDMKDSSNTASEIVADAKEYEEYLRGDVPVFDMSIFRHAFDVAVSHEKDGNTKSKLIEEWKKLDKIGGWQWGLKK